MFRVIRDSDIEVEEEAEDLVRYFRTAIQRRRRGRTVLLELDEDCDETAEALLREQLEVEEAMIVKSDGHLQRAAPRPQVRTFQPALPRTHPRA